MPSCISNTVPEHWVRTTEKQKRKNESLVHRSTMGFIVTCGVHQRGSWQVRTSFPTRKFPERKNLCLKNSSPANQETEISWCALLPCPKHFWVPLPLLFLPFTFYKWVSTSFWAGKNPFPCSFRGAWRFFPSMHNNNPKLSGLTPLQHSRGYPWSEKHQNCNTGGKFSLGPG